MTRSSVAVLAALVAVSAVAGCLSNTERAGLAIGWEPEAELFEGPVRQAAGWPVVLVVGGVASLEGAPAIEVTAAVARIGTGDEQDQTALSAFELIVGENELSGAFDEELPVVLRDGDEVRVSFGFSPGHRVALTVGDEVPVRVEVQWRYKGDDRFDAGRLLLDANLTVLAAPALGLGAAEVTDDRVRRLVFESVGRNVTEGTARVKVVLVTTGGPRTLAPLEATISAGEGVALAELTPRMRLPDDPGYVVLILEGDDVDPGTVVLAAGPTQEAVPLPGAILALGALLAAAALARRR